MNPKFRVAIIVFSLAVLVSAACGSLSPPNTSEVTPESPGSVPSQPTPWPTMPPPVPATFYVGINTSEPPFDDVRVRRAFAMAVDREGLLNAVGWDGRMPATTFVPPDIWPDGRNLYGQIGCMFDVEEARDLLSQAQFWDTPSWIELHASTGAEDVARFLESNWKEYLGVEVEVILHDPEEYLPLLDQLQPQTFLLGWYADYDSPYNFLADAIGSNEQRLNWSNEEYDELVEGALAAVDLQQSLEMYERAEYILCVDEAGIIPIYYYIYTPID